MPNLCRGNLTIFKILNNLFSSSSFIAYARISLRFHYLVSGKALVP
jgi:hypothetical protein